jgi:uncharacterized protein YcfJ
VEVKDGSADDMIVGFREGVKVEAVDGLIVGVKVGTLDGEKLGTADGFSVGKVDGAGVGAADGSSVLDRMMDLGKDLTMGRWWD